MGKVSPQCFEQEGVVTPWILIKAILKIVKMIYAPNLVCEWEVSFSYLNCNRFRKIARYFDFLVKMNFPYTLNV